MPFPFESNAPKKDINRVLFDLVSIARQSSKQQLFDHLESKGFKPMNPSMITDGKLQTIAIPLKSHDHTFGYVGIHVMAEQIYHGAKHYQNVESYINAKTDVPS